MPPPYDNLQPSLALTQTIVTSGAYLGHESGTGAGLAFVRNFAGNFGMSAQPLAHGQLLSIAQNTALFSLMGIYYGGNGTTNFALPNLDGRVAVGAGVGPGLTERHQGEQFGQETVNFGQSNLPSSSGGTSTAFDNDQPSLAMHYMIQVVGVFPSDNGGSVTVGNQLIGDVALFAGDFSPSGGWMDCDGRLLNIAEYEALFTLIGTTYGGDGQNTFALPDLRGRAIVGAGQGGGLPNRVLGEVIGSETGQLTPPQMPGDMGGSSAPVQNSQPSLALNYMIALHGVFPSSDSGGGYEDNSAVYIGEVMATALNFAPGGFALCQGQLLSIQQNQALFSILGTMYGGNGTTTFALPDLRGRSIIGTDANHLPGERFGTSSFSVTSIDAPLVINDDNIGHTLYGGEAGDTINGNGGADTLQGNGGADTMSGGQDDDTYVVDNIGDVVIELNGQGTDTVQSSVSYSLVTNFADNLTLTGSANIDAIGNGLNNVLTGNSGINTLTGGRGDDTYVVNNTGDIVVELNGRGTDLVLSSVSFSLATNFAENLTLTGSDNIDATGNGLNNILTGNSGINTLIGGSGNDTYVVNNTGDIVVELNGKGTDLVQSSVTYSLASNFAENLTLTGTDNIDATGNGLNNVLTGNAGINTLSGGLGDDTYIVNNIGDVVVELYGKGTDLVQSTVTYSLATNFAENLTLTGSDNIDATGNGLGNILTGNSGINTLSGGLGDDTYIVNNTGDVVIELNGKGTDLVQSSVSYSIASNFVENLTLTGVANVDGTGNGLANILTGNAGNNRLNGGVGTDTLVGGSGDDTYVVDDAADVVTELYAMGIDLVQSSVTYSLATNFADNLTLTGSDNIDATGNGLANVLTGNAGINTLSGGLGDDTYIVNNIGDVVVELNGKGTDLVQSSVSYNLATNFAENLTLTGSANIDATGNGLANILTGNAGINTLSGGLGDDTYVVNNTGDVVIELNGKGTDLVQSSVSYSLATNFAENLTLTGSANIDATGNGLGNVLTGNSGINTLSGGLGDDTYIVNNTGDVVIELNGKGTDLVQSSVSYSIASNFVENLTLTGLANIDATGNGLSNILTGNSGINTLSGGLGDDTYIVNNTGDVVIELFGKGTDLVQSSVTYSLATNFADNLTLTGSANINATGNGLANFLTGNSGNNTLNSAAGTDTMNGGAGNDVLTGGLGGDTFVFDLSDSAAAATTDSVTDLNFGQNDALSFVGFGGTVPIITSYHDLATFVAQTGASVVAGPSPGVARLTLTGANGHTQTINLTDTSGNGTALQQYQAAAGSLTLLSTGLPLGSSLSYYARFVDAKGAVISSDGNNGWVALQSFSEGQGNGFVAFGSDRAATTLYASMMHGSQVGIEVEAYQTVNGQLQLVDQYLFEHSQLISNSGGTSQQAFSFNVGQVEHDHWARDAKGTLQTPTEFGWDYNSKSTVNLSEHANFITDGKLAGGQDKGLQYVVRIFDAKGAVIASEGSNGWMPTSGLSLNVFEGKAELSSFLLNSGKASIAISNALQNDSSLRVEVEAYKVTTNGIVTVDEYLFSNVHVLGDQPSAPSGGTPQEGVSFRYEAFQQTHNTLDGGNKVAATSQSGWNFITKSDAVITDVGDFTAADTTGPAPSARMLVGRFVDSKGVVIASEGTNGWVAVSALGFNGDSANYHPPGGHVPVPLFTNVNITGSDKLTLALERAQLAGSKVSFQVESLALIGGLYTQVDEYLFSGASIIASTGVDGITSISASVDAFTHTYAAHDAKGAVTSTSATGWDFITKAQVTMPDTVDFLAADQTANPDEDLTYVVRFLDSGGKFIASDAGSSGWIATTSVFSIANGEAQLDLRVTDDAARLALTTAMLNGTSVRADVEAYRTTASGLQLVDDYLFANVAVNAMSTSDSGLTDLSLTPLQYTHLHNVYDAKGVATQSTAGWDFKANSATTLSDAGNYATAGVPFIAVDQPTHLTYYARFLDAKGTPLSSDGSGGWVALSVFGESVLNSGGSKTGEVVVNFGDDQLFQALNLANLNGTTSLTLEVDGFAGTQLVDQNLFAQINIRQLADPNGGTNPFYIDFLQTQSTHYVDSKASVSQGWYLGTGSVPAPLTSVGAYNPAIPAGGGAPDHITYYMKLLDQNGQTILTDGGHAFSEISGLYASLTSGQPNGNASVTLGSDQSLLASFQALVEGHALTQIEIEAYVDSPTGPRLIDEYLFNAASLVVQYETGSPYSTLTFTFAEYQQAHYYDTGKGYNASLSGWDFALNDAVSSFVTPHADLFS